MESLDPLVLRHLQTKKPEERIEDLNNQIWIADDTVGYRLVTVIDEGLSDVLVGFRDEQGFFEKKRVEKQNCEVPSLNNYSDDLCTLTQPNAATVLNSLILRYTNNVIHTYCGLFCVVINPWKNIPIYNDDVKNVYQQHCHDLPPHVYSVAQNAVHGILKGGTNQSILITGESGAGKTENTKKIIDYVLKSNNTKNSIGECVVTSGVLLEALGNARTTHNSNSSRFGKFIRIEFDENAKLVGAKIECYLLEKSRVVNQCEGDRNFHIFYQMISEYFDTPHKSFLKLTKSADEFKFLKDVHDDPSINDAEAARITDESLTRLGITSEQKIWIFQILSAILWIGDIKFGERSGLDLSFVESMKEIDNIAELLEIKNSKLVDALTQPTIKVHDKLIRKNQNLAKTLSSASAMAKVLYERLFNWVVQKCNEAFNLDSEKSAFSSRFIAVLDIAGFEIIQKNSFEQFCINYTNEKLQQFFNHFMFVKEQADYLDEGIRWQQVNFANHLQPTVDLIEKPMGILSLLEEECVVPNGSEKSLVEKLCSKLSDSKSFAKSKPNQRCSAVRHFSVKHYAGEVHYNIDGWLDKNRDNVENSVLELLTQSNHPLLKALFPNAPNTGIKARRGTITNSTVSFLYKNQLQNLLDTLNTSAAHFIRCVVPNYEKQPGKVDAPLVLAQLRCNGVLEGIRICREGYPSRMPHDEFVERYSLFLTDKQQNVEGLTQKEQCSMICYDTGMRKDRFAVGKTKIFAKVGVISELEKRRNDYISSFIILIQARIRYYNARKEYKERKDKAVAVLIIQQNVRNFAELSQWPWYRIHQLSRGLIPRNREKERIEQLENEIHRLGDDIESLEEKNEEVVKDNMKLSMLLEREKEEKQKVREEVRKIEQESREKLKEKEREFRRTMEEMEQNEEIFNVLERKYNEQHKKVMKMNDVLREYERNIEKLNMEKSDLEAENQKLKDAQTRNGSNLEGLEKELAEKNTMVNDLQNQVQKLCDENNEQRLMIAKVENEMENEKSRRERQNNTISELQKLISELNEKIARFDVIALNEKNSTRKIEREKEKLSDELTTAKDIIQRQAKKIDELKEECRRRGNEIKRLEKKLEDKEAMMADCVKDLKDSHKERVKELEQKVEDIKRKNSKLENENNSQKSQIDTFQRESSVDSDYGRSSSGRLSTIGRQYSLTSMGSFSSIRTVGLRRKDSESDLTSSMYSLRRKDSLYDMTQSFTSSSGLQRSPSTSQVMEKERRILELEKEKSAINTDLQLVKRELDVYKSQLSAVESEKESLQQTVRKQANQIQESTRQLTSAEKNADNLALRLKKALADSEEWKKKHEASIQESKYEILSERKRAMERAEASEKETELKQSRMTTIENAKSELNSELIRTQGELDRCRAIVQQLEENMRSQETLGNSFESQQRNMNFEIESLRDENCALKAKIRRQYKQIELLTQQDETNDELNHFQNKVFG